MARFYATIKGNRGEASRMGTQSSGISGHIRGWNVGVKVVGYADNSDHIAPPGRDTFEVYATSGSNGGPSRLIARVYLRNGVLTIAREGEPSEA